MRARHRCFICRVVVVTSTVVTPEADGSRRIDAMHDACGFGTAFFLPPPTSRPRRVRRPRSLPLFPDLNP